MCGQRCTGNCCEGFVLSGPGRSLHRGDIETALRLRSLGRVKVGRADVAGSNLTVFEMVTPIEDVMDDEVGLPYTRFGCRYFDPASRNCTIYDQRPVTCRVYPDKGKGCEFDGCTYEEGDADCADCKERV